MKKRTFVFSMLLLIVIASIAYLFILSLTPSENEKVNIKTVAN